MFSVAGEQEIIHTKPFFLPVVSAATCTDHHFGVEQRSTQYESRSTLDLVPRTACCQSWDSVSTPPPGQVDTLRKYSDLRWMIATCQPRALLRPLKLKRNSLKIKGTSPKVKRNSLKVKGTSPRVKRNSLKLKGTSLK
ncbi:hypothetical protein Taro_011325, partial [Colocasia esculenta]|nr:hypothetical protein [Colocasia esculenta]